MVEWFYGRLIKGCVCDRSGSKTYRMEYGWSGRIADHLVLSLTGLTVLDIIKLVWELCGIAFVV